MIYQGGTGGMGTVKMTVRWTQPFYAHPHAHATGGSPSQLGWSVRINLEVPRSQIVDRDLTRGRELNHVTHDRYQGTVGLQWSPNVK